VDAGHIEFEGGTRYAFHIRDDELVMIHLEEADEIPVERRTVVFFRVK
jgi:hypothetical protein